MYISLAGSHANGFGLRVCLADLGGGALEQAAAEVALVTRGGPADVLAVPTDVSKLEEVQRLKDRVYDTFGEVAVLMNNAGTSPGGGPLEHFERWQRVRHPAIARQARTDEILVPMPCSAGPGVSPVLLPAE